MHGLIFETSIYHWQDQPDSEIHRFFAYIQSWTETTTISVQLTRLSFCQVNTLQIGHYSKLRVFGVTTPIAYKSPHFMLFETSQSYRFILCAFSGSPLPFTHRALLLVFHILCFLHSHTSVHVHFTQKCKVHFVFNFCFLGFINAFAQHRE